ncbi:phage shock protein B [Sphingorhabdus lutea]|uniref:Phage shock protein B n=1 Tax=Sphingorhabdus lutea TaxID=1913578 RepID=A0A1L3JC15_9SPHN|nr:envelope stress response membrane protein PspB [Sphingorhabdus lutea]APG62666.1 phage shock protein B [Sphingorhabdus lutea]
MDGSEAIMVSLVVGMLFIGLPWLVLHYVTKWKTSATLTNDDERTLGEMHALARRLEDRMDTVERLLASDNPNWEPRRLTQEDEDDYIAKQFAALERSR